MFFWGFINKTKTNIELLGLHAKRCYVWWKPNAEHQRDVTMSWFRSKPSSRVMNTFARHYKSDISDHLSGYGLKSKTHLTLTEHTFCAPPLKPSHALTINPPGCSHRGIPPRSSPAARRRCRSAQRTRQRSRSWRRERQARPESPDSHTRWR